MNFEITITESVTPEKFQRLLERLTRDGVVIQEITYATIKVSR